MAHNVLGNWHFAIPNKGLRSIEPEPMVRWFATGLAKCGWGRRGSECEPKVRGDT